MFKLNSVKFAALVFTASAILVFSGPVQAAMTTQLDFGAMGQAVTDLQTFLKMDSTVYPEGLVTGFFGILTQEAVQRFQCKYDVVCSGTPSTTGYGRVGPVTLAQINALISGGTGGPLIDVEAPIMSPEVITTTRTSAVISWATNEDARSKVVYSEIFPYVYANSPSVSDPTFDQTSSLTITGLEPGTTYYYSLQSVDLYGNAMWTVPSKTFTTKP